MVYYPSSSSAFASSVSYPGYRPVAYTSTTGAGHAVASAGSHQIDGQYVQQVSETRTRRGIDRTDATQQRVQVNPPVGFFSLSQISPEHLAPAFPSPDSPASSSFAFSDKLGASAFATAQPSQPKETADFAESRISASANSVQGKSGFQSAPSAAYGPPGEGYQNFAGSQAQVEASANQGEKASVPASVYSLPLFESGSFTKASSGSPSVVQMPQRAYGSPHSGNQLNFGPEPEREFVFVPAFPGQQKPGVGVELAPPSGGFVPPDGALLSPPAPSVNNVPLPSPRFYALD